jgi:hypothetical protein
MINVIPPAINVDLTDSNSDRMSIETYAMLKSITDALAEVQQQIDDLDDRVTALEP